MTMQTKPAPLSVLVVDDEAEVTRFVCDMLTAQGYKARGVTSGADAIKSLEGQPADLVITDLRIGDVSGLDLIAWIKRFDPRIAVVAITAFGSIDTAIRAIKLGAFDYVTKPFSPETLLLAVEKASRERQMRVELVRLREEVDRTQSLEGLLGKSAGMQEVFALVKRVAPTPTTVLITGAPGTGKTALARVLHTQSQRRAHPFIAISCTSTVPEAVLDQQIFGNERGEGGAFRDAGDGTILLDEVGDLTPTLQTKLLRTLTLGEEGLNGLPGRAPQRLPARVVTTTTHDLRADVASRQFREDLFYRLAVIELALPPLRDRPEDITALAQNFLPRFAERVGKKVLGFSDASFKQMQQYAWPGNVRELENAVERAVTLAEHNVIRPDDLPELLRTRPDTDFLAMAAAREMTLAELERAYMMRVLEKTGGNKLRAAQILGIDRKTIYRWLGGQQEAPTGADAATTGAADAAGGAAGTS